MEIRRIKDPKIIKYLFPFFTEDGAYNRNIIATEFFNMMISTPDEIFVVVIIEEDRIKGFAIGFLPDNREYIWLAQAWSKPGTDRSYGKIGIDLMKQWAVKEHNMHEIRFETNRNPKAIERVWDFVPHTTIMNCKF